MPSFLGPMLRDAMAFHRLENSRNGLVVAGRVTGAFDAASRRRGLLQRDSLPAGHALVIAPTQAIHTFFMRFTIDVVFLARDGCVVKIRQRMRPWRLAAAIRAFAVVELPAGALDRKDTRIGDILVVTS